MVLNWIFSLSGRIPWQPQNIQRYQKMFTITIISLLFLLLSLQFMNKVSGTVGPATNPISIADAAKKLGLLAEVEFPHIFFFLFFKFQVCFWCVFDLRLWLCVFWNRFYRRKKSFSSNYKNFFFYTIFLPDGQNITFVWEVWESHFCIFAQCKYTKDQKYAKCKHSNPNPPNPTYQT